MIRATVQLLLDRSDELYDTISKAEHLGLQVTGVLSLGGAFEVEAESMEEIRGKLSPLDAIKEIVEVRVLQFN